MRQRQLLLVMLLVTIWLTSCAQETTAPSEPAEAQVAAPTAELLTEEETAAPGESPVATQQQATAGQTPEQQATAEQTPEQQATVPPPTATPEAAPVDPQPETIEVTYFTPSQGEGPYYPVNKLDDRDNDLTVLQGVNGTPAGQIIEFDGRVYDATGMPMPGVVVEIWQTDESGVYLHPGDPGTNQRDPNFQFYGESVTAADGSYSFRTILPGRYEPRPRHIHVKVKLDGQELLTTQFYFADDPELAGESMLAQVGEEGEHLIITLESAQDEDGNPILVGRRDIILQLNLSNN